MKLTQNILYVICLYSALQWRSCKYIQIRKFCIENGMGDSNIFSQWLFFTKYRDVKKS